MKKSLTLTAVFSTIFSVLLNLILLFKDVDLTYFKPFLIALAIGYVLAAISLFSIIIIVVYNKKIIRDVAAKRITAVICVLVVVSGCGYAVKSSFYKYSYTTYTVEDGNYMKSVDNYFPYKYEGNKWYRYFGDRYGDITFLEFQDAHSQNGYRAVYCESKDPYLNKRFSVQFNPRLGGLYYFNSDLEAVSYTRRFNIEGVKVKMYIEDDTEKYYAAMISDLNHTLYVQLYFPSPMDEDSLNTFANIAVSQFRLLTNTNIDEAFEWE